MRARATRSTATAIAALVAGLLAAAVLTTVAIVGAGTHRSVAVGTGSVNAAAAGRSTERPAAYEVRRSARAWGVTLPDVPGDMSELASFTRSVGHRPGVVMWYVAWSLGGSFPQASANAIRATGATPEITWEPWNPADGTDQPAYSLARIASGAYDAYLTRWARAVAAWGHPLRLRFAHEMNGDWYPWAEGRNGNAAGSYVKAWRHVHDVFTKAGARNVTWIWSPNVPYPGSTSLAASFPGDRYVNEVALDGYNWGGVQPGAGWTSFAGVFTAGMKQLARLSSRPVSIGEVGCPQAGGNKATWTSGMWHTLTSWPQVRMIMMFSFDKEADWRVTSSPAAERAFSSGVHTYLAH